MTTHYVPLYKSLRPFIILLALILISACGADEESASAPTQETTSAENETPSEPSGEVVIWSRSGDLFRVFDAVIPSFNEKYPNITVIHEAVDINEKLPTTLATGVDVPDGTFVEDINIPTLAEQFTDLSEWMAPYRDDIVPFKLRVNTQNGRIIGVPFDVDPGLLFYRADLVDAAGIDIDAIETYDDLTEAARQAQSVLGDEVRPIHLEQSPFLSQMWVEMFANQLNTSLVAENGDLRLNSAEYLQILEWLNDVNEAGLGSLAEYFSPGDIAAIEADQVVFYPWAQWFVFGAENLFETSKGEWRAAPLPAWEVGGARGANMGGSSFAIPSDADNPYLAWLFFEHALLSPDGYTAVYGANDVYPTGISTSLPAYQPALEEQLFANPTGLGEQNLWDVALSTVEDIPDDYHYAPWYGQAVDIFGANIQRMFAGQLTPQEVLDSSAADIESDLINR